MQPTRRIHTSPFLTLESVSITGSILILLQPRQPCLSTSQIWIRFAAMIADSCFGFHTDSRQKTELLTSTLPRAQLSDCFEWSWYFILHHMTPNGLRSTFYGVDRQLPHLPNLVVVGHGQTTITILIDLRIFM